MRHTRAHDWFVGAILGAATATIWYHAVPQVIGEWSLLTTINFVMAIIYAYLSIRIFRDD